MRFVAVYGGANMERQIKAFARGVDVVVATPGRLIDLIERKEVSVDDLEIVVVDEADRMADMGFLPQVEWILRHAERVEHQTLLFSATLDGVVDTLVKRYQHDPVLHEVESTSVTVEEMEHRFLQVHQMDKVKVTAAIARNASRTMVFVRTKRGADRLAEQLGKEGVRALAIHGDLRQTRAGEGAGRLLRRPACPCWSPPTWPPAASTSTTSTSSCTTTRPRTTRPTCTARAAPPGPASPAWWSPSCCGTRSSRSSA